MGSGWYQLALWVGLIIPLILMAISAIRTTNWGKVLASVLFLVGMLAGRLEFVLSGLLMPTGPKAEGQPTFVSYWPTIWEVFVLLFALSVLLLVYTYGVRNFNLEEAEHS
jgi:molybdopterin-containing oxidoreductase family membrane subunit